MKIMNCPVNGPRPLQEFQYGGEIREEPSASQVSDEQWADFVFNRTGEPGIKQEWWYHIASSTWFIAERDNSTDQILRTFLYETK